MQRIRRFLSIAAYGTVLATLLSLLGWAILIGAWDAAFSTNPDWGGRLFMLAYGGYLGVVFGAKLALWTGITTGLGAATITALLTFPLKGPDHYKWLMQVICPLIATVCTLLLAESEPERAANPIRVMTIVIAALVSFLVSRFLAGRVNAQSLISAQV
jgi:hypothetical protein